MKKTAKRIAALIIASTMIFASAPVFIAFADDVTTGELEPVFEFKISGEKNTITVTEKLQLSAPGENVVWKSSNTDVATVDKTGKVTGVHDGRVVIEASTTVDGTDYSDTYAICVTIRHNGVYDWLSKHNILSYQYRYEDNYFYTNAQKAWQHNFGFNKLYDMAAPYYLMEYDYVRVHFEYEGKDWMIQLWKGQYGLVFYGCETGVYNMEHREKDPTIFTTYKCADEEDWLMIQTKLEHSTFDGRDVFDSTHTYEFCTPYEKTWWSTGFKPGHLLVEEPCSELRQSGMITLKDDEMTEKFVEAFQECGFTKVDGEENLGTDTFYVEGNTVHYRWQEIREAENSMKIKMTGGALIFANIAAITLGLFAVMAMLMGLGIIAIII